MLGSQVPPTFLSPLQEMGHLALRVGAGVCCDSSAVTWEARHGGGDSHPSVMPQGFVKAPC